MGMYDNNFLQDNTNSMAVGSAIQGFLKGINDAQDRDMKKQEFDAKMKAMQTQTDRDALTQQMEMRKNGMMKGADGSLQQAHITPEEHQSQALKAATAGQMSTGQDENGYDLGYKVDPEQLKAEKLRSDAAIKAAMIAAGQGNRNRTANDREDRLAQQIHQKTLNAISQNPQLQTKVNQFQGLDNALSSIVQADHVTPQQIMEFQQAVRGNMGLKGAGGVGEREETYFKTMGMNAANMRQFLTGDPATLAKDSALMEHFKQLASVEQGNLGKQYDKQLTAAAAGHASFYRQHPDLLEDLKDKLAAQKSMMTSQNLPEAPKPQGLVEPQGFLSKLGGLLGGSPATASAPVPAAHPQDAQAVQVARQILADPNSSPEQKQKAQTALQMNGIK